MTQKMQVYKCEVCGNIVEVVHAGQGEMISCGQPMKLMVENTVDASREKHLPVVEDAANGVAVKIGSVPHPMEEKHYIEWIEVQNGNTVLREFLKPGDKPSAGFAAPSSGITARAYCNLHGLWMTKT